MIRLIHARFPASRFDVLLSVAGRWARIMLIAAAVTGIASPRLFADAPQERAAEMKATLQKIGGEDSIERVLAIQDALNSEDPDLRSFVLEKALQSDDRRVRAVAFAYLISKQQRFVVEVTVQDKTLEDVKEPQFVDAFQKMKLNTLTITKYDKNTRQFTGNSSLAWAFSGAIAQDGLTMIFDRYPACKLQFPGAVSGYLVGSFGCGRTSFAAKSALP